MKINLQYELSDLLFKEYLYWVVSKIISDQEIQKWGIQSNYKDVQARTNRYLQDLSIENFILRHNRETEKNEN